MTLNEHKKKSAIIIGAGVAGMAAGSYLQMNGFETRIFERHVLPGGCCTAWGRKGYVFDYCIEWLIGSGPGNDAHQVWRELGALDGKAMTDFDLFNRVIDEQGRTVIFYNDPDRLENHLLEIAPIDEKAIKSFCNDLRRFINFEIFQSLKPSPLMSMKERLALLAKIMPNFRLFWRTAATQMSDFSKSLQDPVLRRAINFIFFQDPENFPMLPFLYNMACAFKNNAGFPEGGSLGLSRSIERRYLSLGGALSYKSKIEKIIVENNQATGIKLKNGRCHYADYIISACDGYTTIYDMLGGLYTNKTIDTLYNDVLKQPGILFPSVISVFIGLKGEVGLDDTHSTTYLLKPEHAANLPGCAQNCLVVQHRSRYAGSFAKPGHSVIHCTYFSDFDLWQDLRNQDKAAYRAQKQKTLDFVINFLESLYPGIRDQIEVAEVATPATTKRYTGNHKGSILGWKAFTKAEDLAERLLNKHRMQLSGLKNFYMAGQWIIGGGLARSALSGRYVAQYLCEDLKKPFVALVSENNEPWHNALLGPLPQLDGEMAYVADKDP